MTLNVPLDLLAKASRYNGWERCLVLRLAKTFFNLHWHTDRSGLQRLYIMDNHECSEYACFRLKKNSFIFLSRALTLTAMILQCLWHENPAAGLKKDNGALYQKDEFGTVTELINVSYLSHGSHILPLSHNHIRFKTQIMNREKST